VAGVVAAFDIHFAGVVVGEWCGIRGARDVCANGGVLCLAVADIDRSADSYEAVEFWSNVFM